MPDDFDVRQLFGPIQTDAHRIDTTQVIRRARRRRLPAQLAVGGGAVVAAGVLVTGAVFGLTHVSSGSATSSVAEAPAAAVPETATSDSATSGATGGTTSPQGSVASTDTGDKRAPATKLNLCGGTLAEVAPSATGLVLTPHFPDARSDAASVAGSVTLTNTSDTRWIGTTESSPSITLSQHGIVLWHTSIADSSASEIDLAPGESTTFPAVLVPVTCGVEDDLDGFRTDLPHVAPGEYQVSAAMDVPADELSDLVTGPTQTIALK